MTPRLRTPGSIASEVTRASVLPGAARTLLLDLDGTLAPIAPTPEKAKVLPGALTALRNLVRAGWSVVVVSGRPAKEAEEMVPIPGVRVYGSHGLEDPEGRNRGDSLSEEIRDRLSVLAAAASRLSARTPGARVEFKPAGVAFHERTVPRARLAGWRRDLRDLLAASDLDGLEVIRGRRVLEVRPRGVHKGAVLRTETSGARTATPDASLVAVGDDETDEDLFGDLAGRGLSILVGRERRTSRAAWRLASPRAVERFLKTLALGGVRRHRGPTP